MTSRGHVFLIDGRGELLRMPEEAYPLEADLQALLARHPDLLPGDQIDPGDPRRWLLVGREIGVPPGDGEPDWWSLDHLFLDQSGIPTFVECKRASDTRSRREVVAQMLDYAANGTAYWSVDKLRAKAEATANEMGTTLDPAIHELVGPGAELDPGNFWDQVDENLRAGRVRLLFVLDSASRELRRLVEFLNERTKDVEFAVVEVKRYAGGGSEVMVPRVLGLTEAAISKITKPSRHRLDEDELLAKSDPLARGFFAYSFSQAKENEWDIYWGTTGCSLRAPVGPEGRLASLIYFFPERQVEIYFGHLELDAEKSRRLRDEFCAIVGFRQAGDYTLKGEVTQDTVGKLRQMVAHLIARVREWIEAGRVE